MQKSIGKLKIRPPPCNIVTDQDFNLKLGTRDYVADVIHHATLGSNRHRGLPPKQGKYLTFVTFLLYCLVFLESAPRSNRRTNSYAEWLK